MSDALDNQRWSSALIEALALGGVREVVVSPGSRNTPLVLAWAARADVGFYEKAWGAIIILLIFLLAMNLIAIILRRKFERRW